MLLFNIFDVYARLNYDSVTGGFLNNIVFRLTNLIAVLFYVFKWVDFEVFMVIWTVGVSLQAILMIAKIVRDGHFSWKPNFEFLKQSKLLPEIIRFCVIAVVASVSSQVVIYIDKLMITHGKGLEATGIYSTAAMFGMVIGMPMVAMQKIAGTIIADAWKQNDRANIANIYQKSCLIQLFVGLWVFMGVCANLHNIFGLFLKPEYAAGQMVVVWIGLSKVIDMATGVNGVILNTSKYYYIDTITLILLCIMTVLGNRWVIPHYGIVGVAVVAALAIFVFNLIRFVVLWYLFDFQPFNYKNIVVVLVSIVTFVIVSFLPIISGTKLLMFLDLLYRSTILSVIFIGFFYFSNYSLEFKQQFDAVIKKIAR
jgi:O-antigen/teichoic acid export membrane protein